MAKRVPLLFLIAGLLAPSPSADAEGCFTLEQKKALEKLLVPGRPMTVFYNLDSEVKFPSHSISKVPELQFLSGGNCGVPGGIYYAKKKFGGELLLDKSQFVLMDGKYLNVAHALGGIAHDRDLPHAFTEDGKALRKNGKGEWEEYDLFTRSRNHDLGALEFPFFAARWEMNARRDSLHVRLAAVNRKNLGIEGKLSEDGRIRTITAFFDGRVRSGKLGGISTRCNEAAPGGEGAEAGCPVECHYWGAYPLASDIEPVAVLLAEENITNYGKITLDSVEVPGENIRDLIPDDRILEDWDRYKISRDKIRVFKAGVLSVHTVMTEFDHRSYLLYSGKELFQTSNDYGESRIRVMARMEWEGRTRYLVHYSGKMGLVEGFGFVTVENEEADFESYELPIDCRDQGC